MRTVHIADAASSVRDYAKPLLEREGLAFLEAAHGTDALERGADEVLLKPLDAWRLVAVADAALGCAREQSWERYA